MVLLQKLTAYKGRQTQSPVTSPVLSPLCTLDTSVRKKLDVNACTISGLGCVGVLEQIHTILTTATFSYILKSSIVVRLASDFLCH